MKTLKLSILALLLFVLFFEIVDSSSSYPSFSTLLVGISDSWDTRYLGLVLGLMFFATAAIPLPKLESKSN